MPDQDRTRRYRFADVDLDSGQRSVMRSGKRIRLGKLTFDFLVVLVERAPNVVTHEELAKLVWPGRIVTSENMTQRVALLRQALGDNARRPKYLRVLHGQGYQLIPPVSVMAAEEGGRFRPSRRVAVGLSILAMAAVAFIVTPLPPARRFIETATGLDAIAAGGAAGPASSVVERWGAALRRNPDDENDLVGLGSVLCESGQFAEALGHLRHARALYPASAVALESLARCLVASSDHGAASEVIAHGVTLNPRFRLRASAINGGFEEGMYGWGLTYDRSYRAGPNRNFEFALDTAVARSGRASARLRSMVTGGQAATISVFVPVEFLGRKVRMTAYLKTEHVEQEAHLWLRVDSVLPGGIDTTYFANTAYDPALRGDTDWTRYEIVADVRKTAAYINYGFGLSGTGTVWVDDVEFEAVSAATPLTRPRPVDPEMVPQPKNLDFARGLEGWTVRGAPDAHGHSGVVRVHEGYAVLTVDRSQRELRQDALVGQFRGHRVRLSARLKRETTSGALRAEMWLKTANYSGNAPALANRWVERGGEWARHDLVVDVPETSSKLMYWISAAGQGALLVDDVRLDVVDGSVPLTALSVRR